MEYGLVLLWLATFLGLGAVGLPLASRLFPGVPDRGAAFALPLALSVTTFVNFWVGRVAFGRWTAYFSVGVLGVVSIFVLWKDGRLQSLGSSRADNISADGSGSEEPWLGKLYVEPALVFTVAFLFLIAIRSVDPAITTGGEKFLDFGLLNTLLRATELPPQDMWWAGGRVRYHYGGHLIGAILTHLTNTPANYAYNLVLAGFYATLVTVAYGLAGAMAHARGKPRRVSGLLGGFFVGFSSNLVTPVAGGIWLLPNSVASRVADWVAGSLAEDRSAELVREGLGEFGYWPPSRVIPGTINEFPLFAFLNGDLHAHMLSTPFLLFVAALGYAYFRAPAEAARRRLLTFAVLPPVIGLVAVIDVWSFPTALGVTWLALLFAPADPLSVLPGDGSRGRLRTAFSIDGGGESSTTLRADAYRVASSFAVTLIVAALSMASITPFVAGVLLRSANDRGIGVLPPSSTAGGLAMVHGAFLLVFALYFWTRVRDSRTVAFRHVGLLVAATAVLAWSSETAVLALVFPLVILGWALLRTDSDVGYETVLVVAGAGLVTLVGFIYAQDGTGGGRVNTVFKVYMQVWVIWATAAGAVLGSLLVSTGVPAWTFSVVGRHRSAGATGNPGNERSVSIDVTSTRAVQLLAAILIVSTGLYGYLALSNHFLRYYDSVEPTLNGTAYLETEHPEEVAAIRWLDRRDGQPRIVSPPGYDAYSWTNPASSLTGLPTVIGWVRHAGLYHGHEAAERRASEVELVYNGTWIQRAERIRRWDVKYIYVGPRARERYNESALQFGQYDGISVAFRSDGVVVYRVDQSEIVY